MLKEDARARGSGSAGRIVVTVQDNQFDLTLSRRDTSGSSVSMKQSVELFAKDPEGTVWRDGSWNMHRVSIRSPSPITSDTVVLCKKTWYTTLPPDAPPGQQPEERSVTLTATLSGT